VRSRAVSDRHADPARTVGVVAVNASLTALLPVVIVGWVGAEVLLEAGPAGRRVNCSARRPEFGAHGVGRRRLSVAGENSPYTEAAGQVRADL
jgi:hypothetical protein